MFEHCHEQILETALARFCFAHCYNIPVNVEMTQTVSSLIRPVFILSLSLSSEPEPGISNQFEIRTFLVTNATIPSANAYRLRFYDENSTEVFEDHGWINSSDVSLRTVISPEYFTAGQVYNMSLEANLISDPLPGVSVLDSAYTILKVVKSSTLLGFCASHNEETNELQLTATLTTDDGIALQNRTVGFYLQPSVDKRKSDGGWVPLQSAETDLNGTVSVCLAANLMAGHHSLEARFAGDDDFAYSSNATTIDVEAQPIRLSFIKAGNTTQLSASWCA
jgi:hypothetical protein